MRNCACGNTEVLWPKVEKMNEIAQQWMFIFLRVVAEIDTPTFVSQKHELKIR